LKYGLLCTSEKLRVSPDPLRASVEGREATEETIAVQTRACFTLCAFEDLTASQASAYFQIDGRNISKPASHFDLFGGFGIALDPIAGRRMGVMPAMYYYRIDGVDDGAPEEMLRRLHEAKLTLLALHLIEEVSGAVRIPWLHTPVLNERTTSEALGLNVDDARVREAIRALTQRNAAGLLRLFDVDRRSSWQMVDKINYVLGLFQNTDSSIEDSPLAFYEQREWRLPYNSQTNLSWYSLGEHPAIRDPLKRENLASAHALLAQIERLRGRPLNPEERSATWVLFAVDGRPFSWGIEEIICPSWALTRVEDLVGREIARGGLAPSVRISLSDLPSRLH